MRSWFYKRIYWQCLTILTTLMMNSTFHNLNHKVITNNYMLKLWCIEMVIKMESYAILLVRQLILNILQNETFFWFKIFSLPFEPQWLLDDLIQKSKYQNLLLKGTNNLPHILRTKRPFFEFWKIYFLGKINIFDTFSKYLYNWTVIHSSTIIWNAKRRKRERRRIEIPIISRILWSWTIPSRPRRHWDQSWSRYCRNLEGRKMFEGILWHAAARQGDRALKRHLVDILGTCRAWHKCQAPTPSDACFPSNIFRIPRCCILLRNSTSVPEISSTQPFYQA